MAGLKEIESILGDPAVKLKEIADTRWLSHENAVTAIRRCLPALITSLEREAAERTDATAAGLATFVKQPKFICTIAMLSDALPHLSMLSKAFQRTSVDFTMIDPMVSATQVTLLRMKDYPGPCFTALDQQFTSLKEFGVKGSDADIQRFQNEVYTTYIQNVINNLHDRYPDNTVLDAMTVLDPDLLPKDDPTQHEWLQHQKLQTLADHFKSVGSLDAAKTEYSSMRELLVTEQFQGRIQNLHCRGGTSDQWSRRLHWGAKRRKGEGGGGGHPLPQVGVRGGLPRKFFEKLHQNGAFWVHFEVINTRFLH